MQNLWLTVYGAISDAVHSSFPLINLILPLIAGCLGCLICGKIRDSLRDTLLRALGLLVFLMGGVELWNGFFVLQTAEFETKGTLLVLVSLVAGYLLGYGLNLDLSLGKLGLWLYRLFVKDKPTKAAVIARAKGQEPPAPKPYNRPSAEGFMLASVICAFSSTTMFSMLDYGSAEDPIPLLLRLGFHALVFFLLAALFGANVNFAVLSIFAVQGLLLLANTFWGDLVNHTLMNQSRLIGAVILLAAGACLGAGKRVRAARFIPAYLIPVMYASAVLLVTQLLEGK